VVYFRIYSSTNPGIMGVNWMVHRELCGLTQEGLEGGTGEALLE